MRKNHMMIATLAMLSVVGSAQYARAQQTGTNQNAKELSGGTILSTVKGVVISAEDGMPVIGASIMVGGGQAQAITDENGCFQLSNVPANSKLKISYIGLVTAFATPSANMKVTLQSDSKHLDDVVVTGMFNRKKEGFTGSAVTIKGEDLKKFSTNNIAKSIAAMAPGLNIMENNLAGSNPNSLPDMRMRGGASMDLSTTSSDVQAVRENMRLMPISRFLSWTDLKSPYRLFLTSTLIVSHRLLS